jgi:hypothetical protein
MAPDPMQYLEEDCEQAKTAEAVRASKAKIS